MPKKIPTIKLILPTTTVIIKPAWAAASIAVAPAVVAIFVVWVIFSCSSPSLTHFSMAFRAFFARAAPIAVLTSFSSSGGGSTAGKPKDSIQSSRDHPVV